MAFTHYIATENMNKNDTVSYSDSGASHPMHCPIKKGSDLSTGAFILGDIGVLNIDCKKGDILELNTVDPVATEEVAIGRIVIVDGKKVLKLNG